MAKRKKRTILEDSNLLISMAQYRTILIKVLPFLDKMKTYRWMEQNWEPRCSTLQYGQLTWKMRNVLK